MYQKELNYNSAERFHIFSFFFFCNQRKLLPDLWRMLTVLVSFIMQAQDLLMVTASDWVWIEMLMILFAFVRFVRENNWSQWSVACSFKILKFSYEIILTRSNFWKEQVWSNNDNMKNVLEKLNPKFWESNVFCGHSPLICTIKLMAKVNNIFQCYFSFSNHRGGSWNQYYKDPRPWSSRRWGIIDY